MRLFPFCLAALLVISFPGDSFSKTTGEDNKISNSEAEADLIFYPLPKYPIAALHKYHQGHEKRPDD